jgi:hypothetical protein
MVIAESYYAQNIPQVRYITINFWLQNSKKLSFSFLAALRISEVWGVFRPTSLGVASSMRKKKRWQDSGLNNCCVWQLLETLRDGSATGLFLFLPRSLSSRSKCRQKIGYKIGHLFDILESKINCDIWYLWYIMRRITFSYNHKLKVLTTILANMFGLVVSDSTASMLTK